MSSLEVATDAVARHPLALQGCEGPEGLSVTEGGDEVWVACTESDALVVLSGLGASAGTVRAVLPLPRGSAPYGIALSRDQRRALVTLSRSAGIAVVDVPGRRVTDVLQPVPGTPLGIAWTEDGRSAWVTAMRRLFDFAFMTRVDVSGPKPVIGTIIRNFPAGPLRSGSLRDPIASRNVAEGGYLTFRGQLAQVPSVSGRDEIWIPTQYGDVPIRATTGASFSGRR